MSRSEPKPKIIYKNLEDLIKGSSLPKNKVKQSSTERIQNQVLTQILVEKQANTLPVRKPKFIQCREESKKNGNSAVSPYSRCYNQIDAIYTDLQDFYFHSKEKVLQQLRNILQPNNGRAYAKAEEKVEEIKKMSDYLKHISKFFVQGEVPTFSSAHSETYFAPSKSKTQTSQYIGTTATESYQDGSNLIMGLSTKSHKMRANRRGESINERKKSIYELILEEKENKIRLGMSTSKKGL